MLIEGRVIVTDNLSFKSGSFLVPSPRPCIRANNRGINFLMQTPLDPFPSYVASYFLEGAKPLSYYPFHVKCINTRAHFCMLMRLEGDTKAS